MEVSFQDWFSKQVGRRFKLKVESSAGACRLLIQSQVFLSSESSEQTLRRITHVSIRKYSGQKLLSPKILKPIFLPCFLYFRKICSHHHCHHFHLRFGWVLSIGWGEMIFWGVLGQNIYWYMMIPCCVHLV